MDKLEEIIERNEKDINDSKEEVANILNLVEYSLDELDNIENPNILVLGTGPHFPEAKLVNEWSNDKRKYVNLTCVDREDPGPLYIQKFLNIFDSEYFKMNVVCSDFESYSFDKQYDLILLLRYSNLSLLKDEIFSKIVKSIKGNGVFIMSGGVNERFGGYSLQGSGLNLERSKEVPFSENDLYKSYGGKNLALKFRKNIHGI